MSGAIGRAPHRFTRNENVRDMPRSPATRRAEITLLNAVRVFPGPRVTQYLARAWITFHIDHALIAHKYLVAMLALMFGLPDQLAGVAVDGTGTERAIVVPAMQEKG